MRKAYRGRQALHSKLFQNHRVQNPEYSVAANLGKQRIERDFFLQIQQKWAFIY